MIGTGAHSMLYGADKGISSILEILVRILGPPCLGLFGMLRAQHLITGPSCVPRRQSLIRQ